MKPSIDLTEPQGKLKKLGTKWNGFCLEEIRRNPQKYPIKYPKQIPPAKTVFLQIYGKNMKTFNSPNQTARKIKKRKVESLFLKHVAWNEVESGSTGEYL